MKVTFPTMSLVGAVFGRMHADTLLTGYGFTHSPATRETKVALARVPAPLWNFFSFGTTLASHEGLHSKAPSLLCVLAAHSGWPPLKPAVSPSATRCVLPRKILAAGTSGPPQLAPTRCVSEF